MRARAAVWGSVEQCGAGKPGRVTGSVAERYIKASEVALLETTKDLEAEHGGMVAGTELSEALNADSLASTALDTDTEATNTDSTLLYLLEEGEGNTLCNLEGAIKQDGMRRPSNRTA
eukprot:220806-Chlamydomonas_euryale.AAC.2